MSAFRTGSAGLARDLNRVAILRLVGASGPLARTSIAKQLGLSPATVTSVTRELIEHGILREADQAPSSGGRPPVLLELVGGAATAVGVKIAPDHLTGARVDLDAGIRDRFEVPFDASAPNAVERVGDVLESWLSATPGRPPLLGIGLGVPGAVHARRHTVSAPSLGWEALPLGDLLQHRLGVPVLVDNDVNTLAVWERLYGRGIRTDHFITVTIGRGVGLGIVAGGDIYHGADGGAGEFGHVTVVESGARCSCGKYGCLETAVGDPALVTEARRLGVLGPRQGIVKLTALADNGDPQASAVFERAGALLGRAVAGLVNILNPELVLVSGEGTRAWVHLAASFEHAFRHHLFPPLAGVEVEVDPWDDMKWAVGAAALVLRSTFALTGATHADSTIRDSLLSDSAHAGVVA